MTSTDILIVSIGVIFLIFLVLLIFYYIMTRSFSKIEASLRKCPILILQRYKLWNISFILWTIVQYALVLIPLFTSLATIYFATDLIAQEDSMSAVYLAVMAFISALLPLVSSKVMPKAHADGFYKGLTILENGILKHEFGLITTEELIEEAHKAEPHTNPLFKFEDLDM